MSDDIKSPRRWREPKPTPYGQYRSPRVAVSLPEDVMTDLKEMADHHEMTLSAVVRHFIKKGMQA